MCDCARVAITKEAPDFTATAVMPDGSFKEISLTDFRGSYVLLYFYPLDFTFVCPSEILAFDKHVEEFKKRNVVVLGCSVDSHFTHYAWREAPRSKGGIGPIHHPLISDITKRIARKYNVLLENQGVALRGLFLIDKEGIVRHQVVNDLPLGRSVVEALRMVEALQHYEQSGDVCPANWQKGEQGMKATTEGVAEYLNKLA